MGIKAILFDSGKVMNGPRTDHWFVTPKLLEHIGAEKLLK